MRSLASKSSSKERSTHLALRYFELGKALSVQTWNHHDSRFQRLALRFQVPASANTYYKSLAVYRTFKQRKILQKLCRADAAGRSIGWTHVVELLQVPQASHRQRLARQVVAKGLHADALRHVIRQEQRRGSKRPASGRRFEMPLDVSHAVARAEQGLNCLKAMLVWLKQQQRESGKSGTRIGHLTNRANQLLDQTDAHLRQIEQALGELKKYAPP